MEPKKRGAVHGNKSAVKEVKASARAYFRAKPADVEQWKIRAERAGLTLSQWMIETLNANYS